MIGENDTTLFQTKTIDNGSGLEGALAINKPVDSSYNLDVSGDSIFRRTALFVSDVSVNGLLHVSALDVENQAVFQNKAIFQDHALFQTDVSVNGLLDVSTLDVENNALFQNTATFQNDVLFNGNVGIRTAPNSDYDLKVNGDTNVGGRLSANGGSATGIHSVALGKGTSATGHYSFAMGQNTSATGYSSVAVGKDTSAHGDYSFAMGQNTSANGNYSVAIGQNTSAPGYASVAMGQNTSANANLSFAIGQNTSAPSVSSFAMGQNTVAKDYNSLTMGYYNESNREAIGTQYWRQTGGNNALVIGNGRNEDALSDAFIVNSRGDTTITGQILKKWNYPFFSKHYREGDEVNPVRDDNGPFLRGYSVAVNHNGSVYVSGAINTHTDDVSFSGALEIYDISTGIARTQIIQDNNLSNNSNLGYSVAIDGSYSEYIVAGAPGHNHTTSNKFRGVVKVYNLSGDEYTFKQNLEPVLQSGTVDSNYSDNADIGYGKSIAISADSKYIVVGAPQYSVKNVSPEYPNRGQVFVYKLKDDGSGEYEEFQRLLDDPTENYNQYKSENIVGEPSNNEFGYSVSISEDGKYIVVGAPGESYTLNSNDYFEKAGAVVLYKLNGDGSQYIKTTKVGDTYQRDILGNPRFGHSVSISPDGGYVIAGSPYFSGYLHSDKSRIENGGAIVIMERQYDDKLNYWQRPRSAYQDNNHLFGYSVTISRGGKYIGVTSPFDSSNGNAEIYELIGNEYKGKERIELWVDDGGKYPADATTYADISNDLYYLGTNTIAMRSDGKNIILGQPITYQADLQISAGMILKYDIRNKTVYNAGQLHPSYGSKGALAINKQLEGRSDYVLQVNGDAQIDGNIDLDSDFRIQNMADPVDPKDAATKGYVDSNISDRRIKKDIVPINDNSALQKVRDLEAYYYYYIDQERRGNLITAGFIAQEVKEIIPEAVTITTDFIPSEYRYLTNPNWIQIEETDIDGNTTTEYKLHIPDLDLSGDELNGNVEFKFKFDDKEEILTTNKDDPYSFTLNVSYTEYNSIFIYGKKVNDFHRLNKAKIFTYHHSAIQELDRQQIADKERIATLETQVATLETDNAALKTQVATLETNYAALLARIEALENPPSA